MHDANNQVENACTCDTENVSSDDDKSSEEEEASTDEIFNKLFLLFVISYLTFHLSYYLG